MAKPVVTDKWAGNFDCSVCRRKRLMGSAFSKKALEKHRKTGGPLKCKECVQAQEEKERQQAAAKRKQQQQQQQQEKDKTQEEQGVEVESRVCASCQKVLPQDEYNRNQWSKGEGKSRCRPCVEKSIQQEAQQQSSNQQKAIDQAREKVRQAKATGNPAAILQAESVLSALEAETVTGLKPVQLGRGGRGRGRGGGRGRGRTLSYGRGRGRGGRGRR